MTMNRLTWAGPVGYNAVRYDTILQLITLIHYIRHFAATAPLFTLLTLFTTLLNPLKPPWRRGCQEPAATGKLFSMESGARREAHGPGRGIEKLKRAGKR